MAYPGRGFRIKKNEKCEMAGQIVVVDTETLLDNDAANSESQQWHKLRCGHAVCYRRRGNKYVERSRKDFTAAGPFWAWLFSMQLAKQSMVVVAHNWHYDAQALGLWQLIDRGILKIQLTGRTRIEEDTGEVVDIKDWHGIFCIERNPFIVYAVTKNGCIQLIDNCNFFPMSLDELGKKLHIEKMEMPAADADLKAWQTYCKRDVDITAFAFIQLMENWRADDLGNRQPTATKLAWGAYRHKFMRADILCHVIPQLKKFERLCYYGGEIKNWFRGRMKGPIYHLDVSSMYPYVMQANKYPSKLVSWMTNEETAAEVDRKLVPQGVEIMTLSGDGLWAVEPKTSFIRCAYVQLNEGGCLHPARSPQGLNWPRGPMRAFLCGNELDRAVRNGWVDKVYECAWYQADDLFSDWVKYWWERRVKAAELGADIENELCKMMLNSLYGRFGMRQVAWTLVPGLVPPIRWGLFMYYDSEEKRYVLARAIGGNAQQKTERGERKDTLIPVAACTTANGRCYMQEIRGICPDQSIIMQNTDSLIVTESGWDSIRDSEHFRAKRELGKLRLVDVYSWIEVHGANHYKTNLGEIWSGMPRNRKQVGDSVFEVWKPRSSSDIASSGPDSGPVWERRLIDCGADDSEKYFGNDGWRLDSEGIYQ